jgi:hypothetical protein
MWFEMDGSKSRLAASGLDKFPESYGQIMMQELQKLPVCSSPSYLLRGRLFWGERRGSEVLIASHLEPRGNLHRKKNIRDMAYKQIDS